MPTQSDRRKGIMGTEEGREIMFAEAQGLFLGFLPFVYLASPIRVIFSHHFADKETRSERLGQRT